MSDVVNLDEARAARREAGGETPKVVFGGKTFELPVEFPYEAAESMARTNKARETDDQIGQLDGVRSTLGILFGSRFSEFMAERPSLEDLTLLLDGIVKAYGFESPGESSASPVS